MAKLTGGLTPHLLQAALEGLEAQKLRIEDHLQHVRSLLGLGARRRGRPPKSAEAATVSAQPTKRRRKRTMSAEARARISAAQKKRWAATKRKQR
jgi:hypothetical protein